MLQLVTYISQAARSTCICTTQRLYQFRPGTSAVCSCEFPELLASAGGGEEDADVELDVGSWLHTFLLPICVVCVDHSTISQNVPSHMIHITSTHIKAGYTLSRFASVWSVSITAQSPGNLRSCHQMSIRCPTSFASYQHFPALRLYEPR